MRTTQFRPAEFDEFSPYPPIADYGFLSDCEVTALIAPGGSVEWMCLPRLDDASVFGSMLDRDAGWFRFGPADMAVPADRRYLAGTMVLETVWDCGEGWLIVRDCLVMGPWRHEHPEQHSHRRPPTDYEAENILLRTVRCTNGAVQLVMDCHPAFDYGQAPRALDPHRPRLQPGVASSRQDSDLTLTLTSDVRIGIEGPSAQARTLLKEGETRYCALSWGCCAPPLDYEDAQRQAAVDRAPLAALARPRQPARPPLALAPHPQRADAQGPRLRPDRRDRGGRDHLAARDSARRAELGLPLQLDPRLDIRALGPVHARI